MKKYIFKRILAECASIVCQQFLFDIINYFKRKRYGKKRKKH